MVMLHVCTAVCANMFIQYGDINILLNSIWPASAILDLLGEVMMGPFMVAIPCENFVMIGLVVFKL